MSTADDLRRERKQEKDRRLRNVVLHGKKMKAALAYLEKIHNVENDDDKIRRKAD